MFARRAHQRHRGPRRAAHRAARSRPTPTLEVDGQDVVADVHDVLRRVYAFADQVRSGAWTGVTGERIRTVVNIGIGGSDLGPVMAYEALAPYRQDGLECRFISNIDPTDAATTLAGPRPGDHAVHRLQQDLRHPRDAHQRPAVQGLAARRARAAHDDDGGRRASTSSRSRRRSTRWPTSASTPTTRSASGTGSAAATRSTPRSARRSSSPSGPERFAELLAGFHAMDEHFRTTEPARNVPLLMGLLNVWYTNFLGAADPRGAPLRPAAAPLPGVPPAADDGVQRQGRALGRHPGDHRHRRGVLGRARHQRPARVLPADPPGHPARSRPTSSPFANPAYPLRRPTGEHRRPRAVPGQLLRPDPGAGVRQDRRRGAGRGHRRGDRPGAGVPRQPADGVDHGARADARRCSASWSRSTSTSPSPRASSGASTASTSGASSSASSWPSRSVRPSPATPTPWPSRTPPPSP